MERHQTSIRALLALAVLLALGAFDSVPACADELPGYYEFFLKTGKLSQLSAEVKRDEAIQAGSLKPVAVNQPVLELELPDGFNKVHSTREHIGKKNLVMITGRAWW